MSGNHKHTTVADHMPSSHRRHAGWTIERIRQIGRKTRHRHRPAPQPALPGAGGRPQAP
jgi:hypothetical protein